MQSLLSGSTSKIQRVLYLGYIARAASFSIGNDNRSFPPDLQYVTPFALVPSSQPGTLGMKRTTYKE